MLKLTRNEQQNWNSKMSGGGSTDPYCVAKYIKQNNFHGDLVFITDGQVGNVTQTSQFLGNWTFTYVDCYLIDTGGTINMSCTCAFTRVSPHKITIYNSRHTTGNTTQTITLEDIDVISKINSINNSDDFEKEYSNIEKVIIARTMGIANDMELRDALLKMKTRIIRNISNTNSSSDTVTIFVNAVNENDVNAVQYANNLHNEYYNPGNEIGWDAQVSRLISMADGALLRTFDLSQINSAIMTDRARRGISLAPVPTASVPIVESETLTFPCPITMDDETNIVILVGERDKPILANLDKYITDDLINCPLNIFNYPDILDEFKKQFDHPIGFSAFKTMIASGDTKSPFTRANISGGICLAQSGDHNKATNWTLFKNITGGKKLGNADLWFACLWLLVENGNLEYLKPTLPHLRSHMLYRMKNNKTYISLSGLPDYPTTQVPLGTAIWYIFASAIFNKNPKTDLIRVHIPHISQLKKLIDLIDYKIPDGVMDHVKRVQIMLSMLRYCKKTGNINTDIIRPLTRNCEKINKQNIKITNEKIDMFIPLDGSPSQEIIHAVLDDVPDWKYVEINVLVGLAQLVDPSKSASDIALPITWTPPDMPTFEPKWPQINRKFGSVNICKATCRPYYKINGWLWSDNLYTMYGITTKTTVSCNESFGNFVVKYNKYPTHDELMVYCYNRKVVHGSYPTLPNEMAQFIESTLDDNKEVMALYSPKEYARRFMGSRHIANRIEMED